MEAAIQDDRGFLTLADSKNHEKFNIDGRLLKIDLKLEVIGQLIDCENVADFWTCLQSILRES